jgi:LacI family transcriptional regulator
MMKGDRMRVTIKDVAKACGISITTVSLVLNQKECRVSEPTRKRILDAAKRLNYRPNKLAVGLVTRKTHTIGLIVPDISNFHFAELCKVIEQECQAKGYIVLLGGYGDSDEQAFEYFNAFLDKGIEGLVFAKPFGQKLSEIDERCFDLAERAGLPLVTLNKGKQGPTTRAVEFDFRKGGYLATRHLVELGHRKIGCITGPLALRSALDRLKGYEKALREGRLPYDEALVYEGSFNLESGQKALPYLLGKGVTAIFASNDMMALGVYKTAREYGLKIPSDISLVGFDDLFIDEFLEVPLTTVVHPSKELGRESTRQLFAMIEGRAAVSAQLNPEPVLKARASTARYSG